jgi:hypothetical protein
MVYFLSLLGYGDCLITLSLLEQQDRADSTCTVIGTALTARVLSLLERSPVPVVTLLPDMAAFYAIRTNSLARIVSDVLTVRSWTCSLTTDDVVVLENSDWRNRLLGIGRAGRVIDVPRRVGAYFDRASAFSALGGTVSLPSCAQPVDKARRLVLNPSARHRSRFLPPVVIEEALLAAKDAGVSVCLIDTEGTLGEWRRLVADYLVAPTLAESAAQLRAADRYLGTDSFFMHLAYYRRIPFLAFFHQANRYFAPPGMLETGNFMYFTDARSVLKVREKLVWFLSAHWRQDESP